jgi:hypothetical protein
LDRVVPYVVEGRARRKGPRAGRHSTRKQAIACRRTLRYIDRNRSFSSKVVAESH